ncbi:hypothetical protein ACJZ2D_016074 [Fusarium nematophilum]
MDTIIGKKGEPIQGVEDPTDLIKDGDLAANAAIKGQATTGYENYTTLINASIIANQGFIKQFATKVDAAGNLYHDSPILSGWGSIMSVGQIIGMIGLSFISARWGRKVAMYILWVTLTTSVLTEVLSRTWQVWLVAKLLAGIGIGCLQTTLPTYISEIAPTRIRGGMLMGYSLWWSLGTFMALVCLTEINYRDPNNWLLSVNIQWGMIGVMIVVYYFLPESPFWCVGKGKIDKARAALLQLNRGVTGYDVDQQIHALQLAAEHEQAVAQERKRQHWYDNFFGVDGLRTLVSLWALLTQQFIGLTLFATFGTYFFQQAGVADPFLTSVITSCLDISTVIVTIFTADRLGRRWISCCGTALSWFANIIIGIVGVIPQGTYTNYVFIVFSCFWTIGMSANGAAGWGYIGEISSQRLRPYTAGFAAAATCVVGVAMSQLVPYMVNTNQCNWGLKTGWFYAGVGLPFVAGCWLLLPETSGRSVAELNELFEAKVKPWRFHKTVTATQRLAEQEKST